MASHLWLCLPVIVCTYVAITEASLSKSSINLPDWRQNADYITKCDFNSDESPFCDWSQEGLIRSPAGHEKFYLSRDLMSPVSRLKTEVFYLSGASCLEFWYYKPGYESSELRVLLSNDDDALTQIWSSLHTEGHTWKQVLIPLNYSEIHVKIIFEVTQRQGMEETVFDRIGIQRGQCDSQCNPDTQFWTDEFTQCTCIESQLTCTKIACGDGQPCSKAIQSKRSSDSFTSGTCKVASDLRYTTFDGVKSRFMGHCIHLLTEVCDEAGLLPYFVMEVENEQIGKSSKVHIQQVNLNIQHLRVTLPRREKRKIMVNGIWKKLPLSLDEGKIKISAYGPDVVLQTNFNLSVSFAKTGALEVSVPIQYSNKLCGMCGNFNNLMDDDKNMPDRSLVKDTQILGQKWKSASFYCQDPIVPSMCSESEKLEYADKLYCGVLLSQNGPFAKCSSSLDTSSLFRNCISEMCTTKGDHEAFCDVLQAVEMSCSEVGISVTGWRNATHCSLACGSNSHFNACSSDCPATCSGLDAAEDCGRCQERCDCDDGLLLSGDRCVPMEDCGCWVDGQHYQKGESFMDDNCESLCMCAGQGNIQCSAVSCLTHEVCKVENGVIGCFPSSPVTCSVYGDPHYITFDGKAYSFQGTCNYTIAKACDAGAVQFTLTARNEELRNYTSSSLNSVALDVDGFHLAIRQNKLVYVNGSQITLPFSHSTSVSVSQTGPYVKVETNFGLRFLFNGNDRLFVQVDERHKGRMCGLCGTYSGSQFDDFLTPGGSVVPYPHVFANSWNTHDKEWPCINGSENKPKCSPELENKGFQECSKLFGEDFKACHWFVPPQIFVNSCVHDFCTSGGDQTQLCTSLENYVAACEVSEVFLGDWWKGTVCDVPTTLPTVKPSTPTPSQPTTIISSASCSWSCNFDQDECGWEQLIQDSFDWTRMSGSTPSDFTGPSSDHTTGSGFYMYIEGDGVYHGDSARMLSPKCNTLGTQCMTFWYHMYGGEFMMLSVYLLEENRATKIWSIANNQGNQWHLSQIEINPIGPFRIIVEGIRGLNAQSDVAWDDVTIVHGKCRFSMRPEPEVPSPTMSITTSVCGMDCNFENSLCTWTQMLTDVFDWTRHNGSTPTPKTGPLSDHTTGDGYYLYIEGDSAAHGDTARLLSEECSDVQPQCLQFWYHMYGSSWTMGLSVYLLHGNVAQEVWRKQEDQGNVWHQALVDITPHGKFRILFEGRRGHSDRSDVALDDVSLQRGPCAGLLKDPNGSSVSKLSPIISTVSSTSTPPEPPIKNTIVVPVHRNDPAPVKSKLSTICRMNCNFDYNLCTWTQLLTDVFDWTRQQGSTPTSLTGPSSDHTTGTGYYLYIEGDSATHGDTARLLSEECSDVQPQCLQFWYHMYGSSWTMGLSVYLLHGNVAQEVWRRRENQGNTWHQALVDITPHSTFRILFEGRRGDNARSDVALDDVFIHPGPCADLINHQTASPAPEKPTLIPKVTSATTKSAFSPVCAFDCNYDNNLCTWSQLATDVFDWTRHSGPTSTALTGPSSDHTTGTGYYLYIEGDSAAHGDTARLLSEECSDVQPQCLQFWYHMYGSSWTMGLSVYLLHGNEAQEVWRKREDQGNVWHQALVDITPHGKFRILFEGRRGHSDRSDVALDDVSLQRGPCAGLLKDPNGSSVSKLSPIISTVISTSTPPEPPIKNTIVVPVHRNDPAPVKSKRSAICRMNCNFDYGLCTWTQLLTDVFDWTRQQGSTPTSLTGPSSDHTTGTGYYLYIEGDTATHGDTARLLSEECSDVQPQCLQFWYHMYGSSWTMGLSVYLLHGNVAQEVWRKRENQGNTWHQALVDITPHSTFRILFEGRRGDNARSDVALDDVFIHTGPCADLINHQTASPAPEKPTLIPTVTSATTKSAFSPVCAFDCNFDNNLCTWSQLATDVFDWTRHSGPTSTALTGPSSDHTTGTGYYLYIEGDSAAHGDTARLLSEECSDVQPQCLQFWYHMYGSSWTMGLSVYLLHGNEAQEVWGKRENQGNTWHQALVDITPHGKFKILFEGRRGHSDRSDVALDDVSLQRGPCAGLLKDPNGSSVSELSPIISTVNSTSAPPEPPIKNTIVVPVHRNDPAPVKSKLSTICRMNCNFDYGLCTWTQLLTDVFDWTRQQGSTPTSLTGPSSDHTTGTGYYLYIEGDSAAHGDTARLLSEECSDVQPQCLQFWYHMYGSSWTMGLSVYLLHGNVAQEVWRRRENQGNTWHQAQVDITPHSTFRILFEGRRGDNARSDVALDDVFIHTGPCADLIHHQTASPAPEKPTLIPKVTSATTKSAFSPVCEFDCNFDNNLCTWSQLATDVFDWKRHSGPTSTALTGPSSDHTTGTGYYLYIEGDSAAHGDTARLLSEECSDVQPQCLQFWYHMYGSSWTMGLSVYLLHGNEAQEVWRKREDQGNVWHQALVDITPHGKFRILFEGRRGHSDRSDVALDDVSLLRGPCAGLLKDPNGSSVSQLSPIISTVSSTSTPPEPPIKNTIVVPVHRNDPAPVKSKLSTICRMNCNFDYGLCTWTQLLTDVFDWTRQQGSTPTSLTGPSSDHTTGTGYYLYIEGDSATHGDTARLLSEECSDVQPQCLQFWYHMYGSSWTMGLSVYLLHGNVAQEVWRKRENQGNTWHQAQVDITPHGTFRILFEGRRGDNARSDVALDDVFIHTGPCADLINHQTASPAPEKPTLIPTVTSATTKSAFSPVCAFDCNFDNNLCTWSQLATDVFDWTRHSGPTSTALTGPSSDHTTGTGYYLYIEGDSAAHGDTARLLSEECSDVQPQCLQFWYHMYGSSWTMGLSVYLLHGNEAQEVWGKRENQGNTWHQALVDITPHGKFKILFEGRRGHSDRSDVALDDVSLLRGPCAGLLKDPNGSSVSQLSPIISTVSSTSTPPEPPIKNTIVVPVHRNDPAPVKSKLSTICRMNCNFDYGLCTWTQLLTDVFDWTRQQGSTPTSLTGPSSDHTTGTGYYLYIEGDSATHGDTARLLSEECSDVQPQCLQFWYHMYGSSWTMGLSVYLLHGNVAQEVWRKRENQGNTWHQAQVDITPHSTFRILFEGRRGDNARSDVALDDVFIHTGPCADLINHQTASPAPEKPTLIPTVTSATTKSAFSPVCAFDCNFDNNLCTWSQLATDVFDWTRHSGPTSTALTGPSSDHTTGTGYYLYIEGDSAAHGDTARLLSEECSDVQPQCLQFWYHMYGSSWTMGLSVYLLHGNEAQEVWGKRENQGNTWHQALVDITPHGKFKILFEGRRGHSDRSDVALDDVSLLRGPCAGLLKDPNGSSVSELSPIISTVSSTSTPPEPPIKNTIVVPVHRNDPAPVKSKLSTICRMNCNFDYGLCTWTQLLTDVFDWTRQQGSTPTSLTGPSSDHTTGTGYYLYIEGDSAAHGDTARLLSEECSDVQPQCLQFWYHMYGSSWTMGLSVYLLHGNVAQEVWGKRENQGNTWHQALVDITPHGKFRILFEGRRGHSDRSDVALDDVSLLRGPCAGLLKDPNGSSVSELSPIISTVSSTSTPPEPPIKNTIVVPVHRNDPAPVKSKLSTICRMNCNFDYNLCTWTQLLTDVFDWTRQQGSTPTSLTGPSSDHTTGTGYYLYIEGDSATHGDTARLLSEECSDVQPQCLQFWYHMYGSSWTMGLSVYLLHGNVAQEVWRKRENQGNTWHQALVDITPHSTFRILFEGRRGDNARSDVALDDVFIHTGPCADLINHQTASPAPEKPTLIPTVTSATTKSAFSPVCAFDCNFDNNLCTWSQLATDVFDWTRHSGPTSTALTGPSSDHTTGTGYYLYIEGDSAAHGDTARLLSEECSDVQPQCLQFWYHMYGSSWTMGLSVYLLHGNEAQEVWGKRENQGNTWHQALVDITPHGKFRILFEGRRGHSDRSDVALDDVSLLRGPCAGLLKDPNGSSVSELSPIISTVSSRSTPPEPPIKNTIVVPVHRNDPAPVKSKRSTICRMNCNFDYGLCTWTQLLTDVFDWTRQQGSTPTSLTGPSSDHTTGTGYYLYIEGDSAAHGDTARLLSEECSDVQPQCLQFWYHMYGSSWTMGLSVYLLHGNEAQEVWRKREDQGNVWHQALVDITPHGKFRLLFEGRRGHNARSDVAVDDVFFHRGTCADLMKHLAGSSTPDITQR
ncbi:MAM and LDL-receptor class A domain-containing protein 2 isoform X6 [Hemibagrus wyckioides]|uniref:MAM and LDL-receptor class A domain-containing protein 2 isoform X6 n=1 Tax=Hemibagrus wyckioides TaxID=337641 RepID=UPI00266C0807|nr:MAM and LDL-receptor class A domain-containing protein 2 isoform X6 [Hemibagrus wyckioides]